MHDDAVDSLLARLAGRGSDEGPDPYAAVAATVPDHTAPKVAAVQQAEKLRQDKLDQLLGRIAQLTGGATASVNPTTVGGSRNEQSSQPAAIPAPAAPAANDFFPPEPASFAEAKLTESEVEELALKFLLARGDASGRDVADQMKLPFLPPRRTAAADEARAMGRSPRRRRHERLSVSTHRQRARTGPPARRTLHVFRVRAGCLERLSSTASRPNR